MIDLIQTLSAIQKNQELVSNDPVMRAPAPRDGQSRARRRQALELFRRSRRNLQLTRTGTKGYGDSLRAAAEQAAHALAIQVEAVEATAGNEEESAA